MAGKTFPDAKKLPVRNAANVRSDSEKLLRALIVLFVLMGVAAALVFGLVALRRVLFTSNPRFQLREIIVHSEGYWQDRSEQLASRLGVHVGDNLFSLDPGALRRQLAAIPNVQHCEVNRILPDTLKLRVVERIPRAVLASPRGLWVVDEEGVVIPRAESMMAGRQLPVILGVSDSNLEGGMRAEKLRPALDIIMQVARNFRDIEIRAIHIQGGDKVNMIMRFRGQKMCQALIPVDNDRNIGLLLTALQSAIIHAERRGDRRGIFDLSFDGNVIIR